MPVQKECAWYNTIMPKGIKPTQKQKGWVKDYLETGNATEAAARNYDVKNRHVAQNIGAENMAKPVVQSLVEEMFPDSELYKLHREGLFDEDLAIRHKYLDTAYKIKGNYAPEKKKIEGSLDITDTSKLDAIVAEVEAQLDEPQGTTISP